MPEWLNRLLHCDSFDRSTCRCFENEEFVLFPFDFRKTSEPKHTPKWWAYMGCNWYEMTGVYFDGRQQEKELFMVMCKVDKFEGKKWWHKQKKVCIACKVVSNFFPRGLCMEGNITIIVVRGHTKGNKRIICTMTTYGKTFYDRHMALYTTCREVKQNLKSKIHKDIIILYKYS